ncbi:MAG: YdcF family protein [Nanoarchaeota archaeon]
MKYDLGIALCHEVKENGKLSFETEARVDEGIRLYNEGVFNELVMSGGYILGYNFSVAEKMRDYANEKTPAKMSLEDISLDTIGQLVFLKEGIIDPRKIKSFALITDDWHMPKTEFMAYNIFDESYNLGFFPVYSEDSKKKRREDTLKISKFLKTFGDFIDGKKDMVLTLLENHPFYNGKYPWRNFEEEYFLKRLEKLKHDNYQ